eukprot:6159606-Prymnesium_polylepis.1
MRRSMKADRKDSTLSNGADDMHAVAATACRLIASASAAALHKWHTPAYLHSPRRDPPGSAARAAGDTRCVSSSVAAFATSAGRGSSHGAGCAAGSATDSISTRSRETGGGVE